MILYASYILFLYASYIPTFRPLLLLRASVVSVIDLAGFLTLKAPSDLSKVKERAEYQEGSLTQKAAVPGRWPELPLLHTGIPPVPGQYALPVSLVSEVFGLFTEEV